VQIAVVLFIGWLHPFSSCWIRCERWEARSCEYSAGLHAGFTWRQKLADDAVATVERIPVVRHSCVVSYSEAARHHSTPSAGTL